MTPTISELHLSCEVCPDAPAIGVASMPGLPVSVAYCRDCLRANAHPWGLLLANTVALGGLVHAAGWWVAMVDATCTRLGRSREEFEQAVAEVLAEQEAR